jgi:NAD(P)-dependent dehydrogenase (short-subunit alcohol dehydrogenase family)
MELKGKVCVVTGASSGLGFETARKFAAMGSAVTLVCRDRQRGEAAVSRILGETPDARLELVLCDFASLASLRRFIGEFKTAHEHLDVLFNNAAVMKMERTLTEDGLETMFQVNYLAPFLISESLLSLLEKNPGARIINIALPMKSMRLDFDNLQAEKRFRPLRTFFHTKLCLMVWSVELARSLAGKGISIYATDPGPGKFKSDLTREAHTLFFFLSGLIAKTAEQAASTVVYLATSDCAHGEMRRAFRGRKEIPISPYWADREQGGRLLSVTKELLERHGG